MGFILNCLEICDCDKNMPGYVLPFLFLTSHPPSHFTIGWRYRATLS